MSLTQTGKSIMLKWFVFLVAPMIPMVVWARSETKKTSPPPPSRPVHTTPKPTTTARIPTMTVQTPTTNTPTPTTNTSVATTTTRKPGNITVPTVTTGPATTTTRKPGNITVPTVTTGTAATTARTRMPTANPRIPTTTPGPTVTAPTLTTAHVAAAGHPLTAVHTNTTIRVFQDRSGHKVEASFRNGKVQSIQANGMAINRSIRGVRTITTERNGHTLVSMAPHQGYLQRPYLSRNGTTYVQRTYVVNSVTYTSVYRTTYYGGVAYYCYVPAYYYHPVFYGWVYNPWPAPVYWGWGWAGAPWYGYYGYYFAPYPVYPTASLWLTDYLLAANLQAAYQAQADANAAAARAQASAAAAQAAADNNPPAAQFQPSGADGGATQLSPEVKQMIADEVSRQLAAEQAAAQQPSHQLVASSDNEVPAALAPAQHVFVVASNLDVNADGQECALTAGDVLYRIGDTPDAGNNVTVSVSSSKKADCAAGKTVLVSVQDLQEMHNHFREQIDSGLKTLAANQGKGLPAAPDTRTSAGEVPPPPPDVDVASELQDQQLQADQTEKEVQRQAVAG